MTKNTEELKQELVEMKRKYEKIMVARTEFGKEKSLFDSEDENGHSQSQPLDEMKRKVHHIFKIVNSASLIPQNTAPENHSVVKSDDL